MGTLSFLFPSSYLSFEASVYPVGKKAIMVEKEERFFYIFFLPLYASICGVSVVA